MKRTKPTAKILCSNRVDDFTRRFAVQVSEGRDIERVVLVEVATSGAPSERAAAEEAATHRALFHNFGTTPPSKLLMSVYDDGRFTGVGQPQDGVR